MIGESKVNVIWPMTPRNLWRWREIGGKKRRLVLKDFDKSELYRYQVTLARESSMVDT